MYLREQKAQKIVDTRTNIEYLSKLVVSNNQTNNQINNKTNKTLNVIWWS